MLPPLSEFVHRTPRGQTVFAYVIGGKGVFCNEKNPFAYDALGENYFDMKRDSYIHNGTAVLFDDGDQVTISAEGEPLRFLLISGRTLSLRYTDFIAPMVKAIQEQQVQIEGQAAIIKDQREEVSSLKGRLSDLEARLNRIDELMKIK